MEGPHEKARRVVSPKCRTSSTNVACEEDELENLQVEGSIESSTQKKDQLRLHQLQKINPCL